MFGVRDESSKMDITRYRQKEKEKITKLWRQTGKVEFSQTDHWIKVGGEIFNGFSIEDFTKLIKED